MVLHWGWSRITGGVSLEENHAQIDLTPSALCGTLIKIGLLLTKGVQWDCRRQLHAHFAACHSWALVVMVRVVEVRVIQIIVVMVMRVIDDGESEGGEGEDGGGQKRVIMRVQLLRYSWSGYKWWVNMW